MAIIELIQLLSDSYFVANNAFKTVRGDFIFHRPLLQIVLMSPFCALCISIFIGNVPRHLLVNVPATSPRVFKNPGNIITFPLYHHRSYSLVVNFPTISYQLRPSDHTFKLAYQLSINAFRTNPSEENMVHPEFHDYISNFIRSSTTINREKHCFVDFDGENENGAKFSDDMISHVLACLTAIVAHQARGRCIDGVKLRHFYETLTEMCRLAMKQLNYDDTRLPPLTFGIQAQYLKQCGFHYTIDKDPVVPDGPMISRVWYPIYWAEITDDLPESFLREICEDRGHNVEAPKPEFDHNLIAHYAGATKSGSLTILRAFTGQAPQAAFTKDSFGDLALHYAARYSNNAEVFKHLLQENPAAATTKGKDGYTPLHVLVERLQPDGIDLLECLLNADPAALTMTDDKGNTPLHLAWRCWSESNLYAIHCLVEADSEALGILNSQNELPLHIVCRRANLATCEVLATFETVVVSYENDIDDANDSDVNLFLAADSEGNTLLHCACHNVLNLKAIKLLIERCPQVAKLMNNDGAYPLQILLRESDISTRYEVDVEELRDVIALLMKSSEEVLPGGAIGVSSRFVPLHWAVSGGWSIEVIRMLSEAYPEALKSNVGAYGTPLHIAALYSSNLEVLQYLHSKQPAAIQTPTVGSQWLPLHCAVLSSSFEVFRFVFECHPAAIRAGSDEGENPLHILAQSIGDWSEVNPLSERADILRHILATHPLSLSVANADDTDPYEDFTTRFVSDSCYFHRILLHAVPTKDPALLRKLNYRERREAVFLIFSALFEVRKRAFIWLSLRERGGRELQEYVLSYL
jgi:ankyrin repeat protein